MLDKTAGIWLSNEYRWHQIHPLPLQTRMENSKKGPFDACPSTVPLWTGEAWLWSQHLQFLNWACALLINNWYTGNECEATIDSAPEYKTEQLNVHQQQTLQPCHSYGISSTDVLKIPQRKAFRFVLIMLARLLNAFSERKVQRAERAR